jgi:hypothetical protein
MRQIRPEPVRSNAITDARRSAGIRRASDGRFRLVEPLGVRLRPLPDAVVLGATRRVTADPCGVVSSYAPGD